MKMPEVRNVRQLHEDPLQSSPMPVLAFWDGGVDFP